jgi:NAD(P)-dependent dehydrogenase (short-subunit alcohol dehydrogenase family)
VRIIVTGGNSGVGRATAGELAAAGHSVVIGCRHVAKGQAAAAGMSANVEVQQLDLADLASVRSFADTVGDVDVLINNAGVFGLPLTRTADGFEAHTGVNHLGHFALTCLLGGRITDRVISVGSALYRFGRIGFDDLNWRTRRYSPWAAYAQSKLANALFVSELARRGVRAYLTDPGGANTDITRDSTGLVHWLGQRTSASALVLQSPADAARASIEAVTTDLPSGSYLAPRFNQWGRPVPTRLRGNARDPVLGCRLWELSEDLTHCEWQTHPSCPLFW